MSLSFSSRIAFVGGFKGIVSSELFVGSEPGPVGGFCRLCAINRATKVTGALAASKNTRKLRLVLTINNLHPGTKTLPARPPVTLPNLLMLYSPSCKDYVQSLKFFLRFYTLYSPTSLPNLCHRSHTKPLPAADDQSDH